jgi:hypothetical protein
MIDEFGQPQTMDQSYWGQFQPVEDTTIQGGVLGPNGLPTSGNTGVAGGMTGTVQPTSTAPSGQTWDQNYFATNFGTPKTPQELIALESKITAAGGKVLRNAAGVAGKIQTPDGRIIDVINSAGTGGNGFQWLEGGGGGQGSALAGLGYNFGDSMKPFGEKYALPTLNEFKASPFYGAGLDAYNRQLQNNPAARGTLLNGRVQEGIGKSLMDFGLTQYGQLAGLNKGVFDTNFDIFKRNQDAPFAKNLSLAELGAPK